MLHVAEHNNDVVSRVREAARLDIVIERPIDHTPACETNKDDEVGPIEMLFKSEPDE
jgi:hypothetical protein